MDSFIDHIATSPLFQGIEGRDLKPMLDCLGFTIKQYEKGAYILLDSDPVEYIGFVLSGTVHIVKEDVWGNKTILTVVQTHGLFGETFICGSSTMSTVSFCTTEKTRVLFLPFQRVMHSCTSSCFFHHKLIENMVRLIADKNRSLMEKIEVVSQKTLREKVLAYLYLQAQRQQSNYFEVPLGRVELATYLCADRSALTRELALMRADGLLDYEKNTFRLL